MINYNQKSWHYRLLDNIGPFGLTTNFCSYWRHVALNLCVLLCLSTLGLCCVLILLFNFTYPVWQFFVDPYTFGIKESDISFFNFVIYFIILICYVVHLFNKYDLIEQFLEWLTDHSHIQKQMKQPGVIKTYIVTIKEKMCPLIIFTDEDHERTK